MKVKAILFDLGQTLLDFGPVDTTALFTAGARKAYQYLQDCKQPLPPFPRFLGRQLWSIRWNYLRSRLTGREFNSRTLLAALSQRMGQTLSSEQVDTLTGLWYEPLSRCARTEPGLTQMLQSFTAAGIRLAVVSNTFIPGPVLDRHLRNAGLLEHLPVRVYSCDVGYRKPHPRIFQIALERLGIAPEEALFVGDDPRADIGGATKLGMITVLKDPSTCRRVGRFRPRHRIAFLRELQAIVADYNGQTPTPSETLV